MQKLKFISFLATHRQAMAMRVALLKAGVKVDYDKQAGTLVATYPKVGEIYRAIQKYAGGPWIVRHVDNLFDSGKGGAG